MSNAKVRHRRRRRWQKQRHLYWTAEELERVKREGHRLWSLFGRPEELT